MIIIYIYQGFIQDLKFGGGKLKTFGVYVMGVHKQAQVGGLGGFFFAKSMLSD